MNKLKESDIEKDIFSNLEMYIGKFDKKKKQCCPILPFLQDIEMSYSRYPDDSHKNKLYFSNLKKADILATTGEVLHIVEIKKYRESWAELCKGIMQLMEYNRLAIVQGNKTPDNIELYLVCDKITDDIIKLVTFYQMPITLIEYRIDNEPMKVYCYDSVKEKSNQKKSY